MKVTERYQILATISRLLEILSIYSRLENTFGDEFACVDAYSIYNIYVSKS